MTDMQGKPRPAKESAMFPAKPTLQAPLTGQALRRSVAEHSTAEWTAYAQALRVAGYRVDPARLAEQLLRHGCADVQDAFGHEVSVQVRVPRPSTPPPAEDAEAGTSEPAGLSSDPADARGFHIAC
jgi:hypothetical protein